MPGVTKNEEEDDEEEDEEEKEMPSWKYKNVLYICKNHI